MGGTATIEGRVRLTGPAPANSIVRMGADPQCSKVNRGKRVLQEVVVRSADGGLANAFVHLQGNFPPTPVPAEPVVLDQVDCIYIPRVTGARVGQTLQIKNSDPTLHNLHSVSSKGNGFNVGQPVKGMTYSFQLKSEDVMMRLKCDLHSWMTSYIGVVNHPFFATSDREGAFRISGVPAGKHVIQAWHERFGPMTQAVDVKAGETKTVDFAYTGTEKPSAARMRNLILPAGVNALQLIAPAAR